MTENPVLIEATAKRWKLLQISGAGGMLAGVLITALAVWSLSVPAIYLGALLFACGLVVYAYAATMAWWHHG